MNVIKAVDEVDGVALISLQGRLDADSSPILRAELKKVVERGLDRLVLDFSDLEFMDSTGIEAVLYGLRIMLGREGDIRIAAPPPPVRALFELARLDKVFRIFDSVAQARNGVETWRRP